MYFPKHFGFTIIGISWKSEKGIECTKNSVNSGIGAQNSHSYGDRSPELESLKTSIFARNDPEIHVSTVYLSPKHKWLYFYKVLGNKWWSNFKNFLIVWTYTIVHGMTNKEKTE